MDGLFPAHLARPATSFGAYMQILTIGSLLQAETATSAVPELDYDALASELDKKSPLEIMDHVRVQSLPTAFCSLLRNAPC